jgi:glyoxylase-like metal-dependent hydrolase (beta-lactamase superfamily II)
MVRILPIHAHGDHVGSVDALKERLPHAEVIASTRYARLLAVPSTAAIGSVR